MDHSTKIENVAEVPFSGGHSIVGAGSIPGPFIGFDPHLVLLLVAFGYILLYLALTAIDTLAALPLTDIPTTEEEGSVDGEGIEVPGGPD